MSRSLLIVSAAALGLALPTASAIEPLNAEQLSAYCGEEKPSGGVAEGTICATYVAGFLDGAVTTDARVAQNVLHELDSEETFSERAIRTRLSRRMQTAGPTVFAEFCVGTPVPIAEVVQHVVDELDERSSLTDVQAQDIVYAALRKHYPCQPEND